MARPEHFVHRALRWLAPSAAAACAGAVVAGGVETALGAGAPGVDSAAAVGFVVLAGVPALLVAGVIARGVIAAWRPRELAARLAEEGGGMPGLAGWVATIVLGLAAFAWLVFRGTWLLVSWTQFKPHVVAFAQPVIAAGSALAILLVAPISARWIAAGARRVDARWRRRGRRTLLRPWLLFGAAGGVLATMMAIVWIVVISPRIGPLALDALIAPAAGVAVTALGHAVRARGIRLAAGGLAFACAAFAVVTAYARPAAALGIWGDQAIAGVVIERVFDLDRIRNALPLDDFRPAARAGAKHPDIVIVTIDTMRADRTPPYGGPANMPVLRALGERGAVFQWAFAPSNVTRRSVPTMLTGTAPERVRGRVVGWGLRMDPRHVLLAERLRAAGYDTAGFVCCGGLYGPDLRTGFDRGLATLVIDESGEELGARAARFVAARASTRPLMIWMHVLEPHNWGGKGAIGAASLFEHYDRSLAVADKALGAVVGAFANRRPADAPIIIVTSDHGEGLGDHGQRNHSTDLYNAQVRVPLVIAGPGVAPAQVHETVGLVDLVPTVLDLAGFVPPSGVSIDGRSLGPLARGEPSRGPGIAYAAMIADRSNPGGVSAVIEGPWKLIENNGVRELYQVHKDPDERSNVAREHPDLARRLAGLLAQRRARGKLSAFE